MEIQNKKLDEGVFMQERQEVLGQWPTGKDVDLQEAADYQKRLSPERVFSTKLLEAKKAGRTLIQPRAGVPVIEEHIKLMQYLEKEGEADLLPTTIDSYTRQNRYAEAEDGIQESIRLGRAMLNGFPAVNHGVAGCRRVIESVHTPLQVRHGTPDARLLTEIAYAGGFTSYEGGGISYNLPYCKNVPMETTIANWQYVDRLTGLYEEMGISINREPYGPLTGTLVPPCISHAAAIIEALLAAEQGVRNITVGYGQCGNIVQDIAAIRTLEELTEEYLHKYGYDQVVVTTVLHQWMGGFPADEAKAFGVISTGSLIAALSKATKVIVKSPHEAIGIPIQAAHSINRGKLERQNKFGGMTSSCIIVETAHGIKDEQRNDKRFFSRYEEKGRLVTKDHGGRHCEYLKNEYKPVRTTQGVGKAIYQKNEGPLLIKQIPIRHQPFHHSASHEMINNGITTYGNFIIGRHITGIITNQK